MWSARIYLPPSKARKLGIYTNTGERVIDVHKALYKYGVALANLNNL